MRDRYPGFHRPGGGFGYIPMFNRPGGDQSDGPEARGGEQLVQLTA